MSEVKVPAVPSGRGFLDPQGHVVPPWLAFLGALPGLAKALNVLDGGLGSANSSLATKAAKVQDDAVGGAIIFADDDADALSFFWPYDDCDQIVTETKCKTGTCTATFKKNGVAFGGTANAVSTSVVNETQPEALTLAKDDLVTIAISSSSSCEGLAFSIKCRRTFA